MARNKKPANGTPLGLGAVAGVVLGLIAVLWAADLMLARVELNETLHDAHEYWSKGMHLLGEGHNEEAEELLRKAYTTQRSNATYGLDLVTALTASGRLDEASQLIEDLLTARPNDGPTNLAAARLLVRRGMSDQAKPYHHRAIYGLWVSDARTHRVEVRMELAALLDSEGAKTELLAELLPLEQEVQGDRVMETRVAALYLHAGSPARAATAYRDLIASGAQDSAIYSGLGEAELGLANYSAAEDAFRNSLRLQPNSPEIVMRLNLAAQMSESDPTVRRLTYREKYSRSIRLLQAASDSLAKCSPGAGSESEAARLLKKREPAYVTNEAAEAVLGVAERLWQTRIQACGAKVPSEDEFLERIIAKLTQSPAQP